MWVKLLNRLGRSAYAWPLACAAAVLLMLISEISYRSATEALRQLATMSAARTEIQSLWRYLVDAETGQRGYLLTGRDDYLKPYREARNHVDESLHGLLDYYRLDPQGRPLVEQLSTLSTQKLSELATTMAMYDKGPSSAWHDMMLTDIGQEKMEAIRAVSRTLLDLESQRVIRKREGVQRTLLVNRIGVALTTLISLLAVSLYFRQSLMLHQAQADQQQAIQIERDRLEVEVKTRTSQLTELAQHLQNAREDERSRIARELHDELGALLTAAKLDAARLRARLGTMTPEVSERLAHLNNLLNDGIALKRQIIENLRPSSLSNLGLTAALEIITSEFAQTSGIQMHLTLAPVALHPSGELTVYRLVQEALTNIAKYAHATEVWVELSQHAGMARVSVRDNGCGFDTTVPRQAAHGLLGMRYRVEAEGGLMTLASRPGAGTSIEARLPCRA